MDDESVIESTSRIKNKTLYLVIYATNVLQGDLILLSKIWAKCVVQQENALYDALSFYFN